MKSRNFKIRYKDIFAAYDGSAFLDLWRKKKDKRWYVLIAIELVNNEKRAVLNDEFFLLACSDAYRHHPLRKGPVPLPQYTVVQDELHMKELRKIAQQRVESIKAENAEKFYEEMSKHFITRSLA